MCNVQPSLFDFALHLPEGLWSQPDFLDAAEEAATLSEIQGLDFQQFRWHEYAGKRRTVVFGWSYSFDRGEIGAKCG